MNSFYDIKKYNFLCPLLDSVSLFKEEFDKGFQIAKLNRYSYQQNDTNHVANFIINSSQDKSWETLPIFDFYNINVSKEAKKYFPQSLLQLYNLKQDLYDINTVSFCILNSKSYFPRHKHNEQNTKILHILLKSLDDICIYEVENEYKEIKNISDFVIFDLISMHSVYNFSNHSKISLSISFSPNQRLS